MIFGFQLQRCSFRFRDFLKREFEAIEIKILQLEILVNDKIIFNNHVVNS